MIPRHLGYELAILAIVCSAAIFFFPATCGSYSAVHGPVTALRSFRGRLKRWLGMAFAALQVLGRVLPDNFAVSWGAREPLLLAQSIPPERISPLRC